MVYRVETHDNSKEYFSNLNINSDEFYVTATSALSNMIIELNRVPVDIRWRFKDIESFMKLIYPKWTNTLNQLRLKGEIRKIIIELRKETANEKLQRELNFLEDNINILFSDISFMVEAGVKELKYINTSIDKEAFKQVYNKLLKTNLFSEITSEILDFNSAKEFEKRVNENTAVKIKKIYFYNLNYLDLRRYLIVELLRLAGYEIVFRIPYFNGLKVVNKCWDMVYKNTECFNWIENKGNFQNSINSSKFIAFLEGKDIVNNKEEMVVTKTYNEISEFRKDMKGKKVMTFYKDSIKPCMDVAENIKEQHCFQSALGRFLFELYNCKVKDNTVYLNFNTYRELITSGWIENKGWNGYKLSEYLLDNEAYFSDIETIDDILNRINKLKELEEVNEIFEEPIKGRIKKNSLKRFLSNPFRAFGYVNLDKYNITSNYFELVTIRLKNLILKAFAEKDGLIDCVNHLEMLKLAFRNEYITGLNRNGSETEKKIVKRIWGALNTPRLFSDSLHKDELQEVFNILLKFNKKDEEQRVEEQDFSIDHMEGLILRDRMTNYNSEKAIYISDLSYKAYETYIQNRRIDGKILNHYDFYSIFDLNLVGEHRNIVLKGLSLQMASAKATESYLKFAMGNLFINFEGKKEFSWVSGFRDDDDKAILYKQLENLYENVVEIRQELEFKDIVIEEEMVNYKEKIYDRKLLQNYSSNIPEVAYRDLDFCESKFLFSTILEEHPMYYSEFHEKLALAGIVSMLKNSLEDSYSNIHRFILPLFPQWLEVVKDNILTCEYARKNIREYRYFDGINYPKNIDSLYLLKSKYIVTENSKIRNRYNNGEFKADKYFEEFLKDYLTEESHNSGLHCRICTHIYACRKGEFASGNK